MWWKNFCVVCALLPLISMGCGEDVKALVIEPQTKNVGQSPVVLKPVSTASPVESRVLDKVDDIIGDLRAEHIRICVSSGKSLMSCTKEADKLIAQATE